MIQIIAEIAGYLASVLLAISLLINNDLKFRWFTTSANVCFIIYGTVIQAYPVIVTNSILLFINIYQLLKIYNREEDFDLIEFTPGDKLGDKLINKFLSFHKNDIDAYFPNFLFEIKGYQLRFIVLRDMVIANIFVASIENGIGWIEINYTVPKYRDYKVGRFIFDQEKKYLISKGVKKLVY
ncbi:MAG TPA: YgjV family protein, partial [Flavisolibacter sp.]|nr:YgjV family protein [Flavisolibacter sp.]